MSVVSTATDKHWNGCNIIHILGYADNLFVQFEGSASEARVALDN